MVDIKKLITELENDNLEKVDRKYFTQTQMERAACWGYPKGLRIIKRLLKLGVIKNIKPGYAHYETTKKFETWQASIIDMVASLLSVHFGEHKRISSSAYTALRSEKAKIYEFNTKLVITGERYMFSLYLTEDEEGCNLEFPLWTMEADGYSIDIDKLSDNSRNLFDKILDFHSIDLDDIKGLYYIASPIQANAMNVRHVVSRMLSVVLFLPVLENGEFEAVDRKRQKA